MKVPLVRELAQWKVSSGNQMTYLAKLDRAAVTRSSWSQPEILEELGWPKVAVNESQKVIEWNLQFVCWGGPWGNIPWDWDAAVQFAQEACGCPCCEAAEGEWDPGVRGGCYGRPHQWINQLWRRAGKSFRLRPAETQLEHRLCCVRGMLQWPWQPHEPRRGWSQRTGCSCWGDLAEDEKWTSRVNQRVVQIVPSLAEAGRVSKSQTPRERCRVGHKAHLCRLPCA